VEEVIFEQNSQIIFFIYLLSGLVGASISVYFFKMYRLFSSSHIFGLVIGFALISFADFFFATSIDLANQNDSFNSIQWLKLSITSYGYAFLALVYHFHKSTEKKLSLVIKSLLLSLIPIVSILLFIVSAESIGMPRFQQYNEYFRIVNMASIGYIVFSTFSNSELRNRKLILIPLGFTILLLSQFTRFLFTIDPVILTLELSGILKIIALTIIIFTLTRNSKKPENMELNYD
jgi:hypothetical protein